MEGTNVGRRNSEKTIWVSKEMYKPIELFQKECMVLLLLLFYAYVYVSSGHQ